MATTTPSSLSDVGVLPRIPPELWLRIFDLATNVAGLLDCGGPFPSDLPHAIVKQREQRLLRESLVTKRNLVLVCRAWHELAVEFLYKSVLITRVHALSSLYASLQRGACAISPSSRLGWWTRRLDVVIEDDRCEASDYSVLALVLRHFSKLSIITLSMPMLPFNDCWLRQLPTSVITSLAETCGPSLQLFDCSESILRPCREDLMVLLAATPNLRVLRCPICSPTPGDKSSKTPRLDLPCHDANCLPALRQLTYDCIPPPFFDHAWKNFVKLSCSNLTTVTLDFCLQGELLQKELDLLAECCQALDKLVIHLRSWSEMKPYLAFPPITYLGLHSKLVNAPDFHYQALISALGTLSGAGLKIVRIIHAGASEDLRRSHTWLPLDDLTSLASRTFRLEDHEGNLLLD
ncbi:hypothetical protein F5I97DRAFT_1939323 [Phlebopus sp. FC_14]|nr:hypothetical protein F5I97DRAFT_1939323 [Phlebopus sp. FC_14]